MIGEERNTGSVKRITNCERRDRVNSACLSLGRVIAAVSSGIWPC